MSRIEELLGIGDRAIKYLEKKVDDAEVFIITDKGTSLSIENNKVKSISGGGSTGIAIRILNHGKMGFAYCSDIDQIRGTLELAIQGSAISPEKPFSFPAHEKYFTIPELLDKKVLDLTPQTAMGFAGQMIDAARDVHADINVSGGGIHYGDEEIVIMNTQGLEVSEHLSGLSASIYSILEGDHPTSGYEFDSSHLMIRDFEKIGRTASELAVRSRNPVKIESKDMPVVFKPEAISSMFENIVVPALYGIKAEKGESVYSGKLDNKIACDDFTLIEDPTMPDGENSMKMDTEGVPSDRVPLIKDGMLKNYLYTVVTGAEFDHASTSSGMRPGGHTSPVDTIGRNIILEGSTREEDTLISEIQEGLLIYDLLGAHTSNPASGDFSVTASTIFRIKDGEVREPVSQAMLSGNFPEYMMKISGIGSNYRKLSGGLSSVGFYIPSVRIDDMKITGEM